MIFCTICTRSHLYRAKVLAISLKIFYPDAKLIVALVEKTNDLDVATRLCFDHVVVAEELGIQRLHAMLFRYEANEAACALKGELLAYAMRTYPTESAFVYLDSDLRIYSRMVEMEQALLKHSVILTPHRVSEPAPGCDFFGIYNTGFLALRRSSAATQFIDWWREKLVAHCYIDRQKGIFLDQSWLNYIPSHIPTFTLLHPGYNVAFWNLQEIERRMSLASNGMIIVGGNPLRCFHYSQLFKSLAEKVHIAKYAGSILMKALYHEYVAQCEIAGMHQLREATWSYDYYEDGGKIERIARMHFRQNPHSMSIDNPFTGYGRELVPFSENIPIPPSNSHHVPRPKKKVSMRIRRKRLARFTSKGNPKAKLHEKPKRYVAQHTKKKRALKKTKTHRNRPAA